MRSEVLEITTDLYSDYLEADHRAAMYFNEYVEAQNEILDLRARWRNFNDMYAWVRADIIAENQGLTLRHKTEAEAQRKAIADAAETVMHFAVSFGQV